VEINGAATPGVSGTTITKTHWEWGDGNQEDHGFPASHVYSKDGTYTLAVTSYQSDGLSATKSTTITLASVSTGYSQYTILGIIGVPLFIVAIAYLASRKRQATITTKPQEITLSIKTDQEVQAIPTPSPPTLKAEEKKTFEVKIHVAEVEKLVRLQVESNHTVGSLIESVTDGLNLPKRSYVLNAGEKTLAPSQTLQSSGIKEGDKLELLRKD
jgi:PKD repeat protein